MSRLQNVCGNLVFVLSLGAYLPLFVGGWRHPSEINMASYSIWLIIALMLWYSSRKEGFSGWKMPLGFAIGNGSMLIFGVILGGYTFNLGPAETAALYGVVLTLSVWGMVGKTTGRLNPRILFWGGILADVLSFYPQLKQYFLPHDPPTSWMITGWWLWISAAGINVVCVEQLFTKLLMSLAAYRSQYGREKNSWLIWEESMFSIENCTFMFVAVQVMTW